MRLRNCAGSEFPKSGGGTVAAVSDELIIGTIVNVIIKTIIGAIISMIIEMTISMTIPVIIVVIIVVIIGMTEETLSAQCQTSVSPLSAGSAYQ